MPVRRKLEKKGSSQGQTSNYAFYLLWRFWGSGCEWAVDNVGQSFVSTCDWLWFFQVMLPSGPAEVHVGSGGLIQDTWGSLQGFSVTLAGAGGGHEETSLLVPLFLIMVGRAGCPFNSPLPDLAL